jgi:hypothetical protein
MLYKKYQKLVHSRWRMLEGKDPETLELIQKINNLQKRLITKQEEIIEKDLKIEEIDKVSKNFLKYCLL